jgi:multiple sugar transport system ATP-binding protein
MARVVLKDISKTFGKSLAVDHVSLEIPDQQFLVLVGPSGCGKTTTLRMVAGLEDPTSGEIYIGDRLVNKVPPKDRNLAMVFQNSALYPHMDVYQNLAIGLQLRRLDQSEIDRRVREAAKLLRITDCLARKPAHLSGGQRQRVAMGRAMVRKPEVFLFDEPLSNLDAKLRLRMRAEMKQLHSRMKTTVLYVTHDQVEAMTLADEIAVMNRGIVMQRGSPMSVYRKPQNLFVAGFIGSPGMNLLPVEVLQAEKSLHLEAAGISVKIPDQKLPSLAQWIGHNLILGLRPERLIPETQEQAPPGCPRFNGTVELAELLGAQTVIHLKVGEQELVAIGGPNTKVNVKETIAFWIDASEIHLFDPVTQASILEA